MLSPLIILASLANIIFVVKLKPSGSIAFIFFFLWLTLPYSLLGYLNQKIRSASNVKNLILLAIAFSGIAFNIDIIFIQPDAQGAMGVLMVPIIQIISTAVCSSFFLKR